MYAHWPEPDYRELLVAAAAGMLWALLGWTLVAHGSEAASCRVTNHFPNGAANLGSGTLIDVSADRRRGLVLTCAHLFTEGTGQAVVEFPGHPTHGATLVAIERSADLAALTITHPPVAPSALAYGIARNDVLKAGGFGPNGQFRAVAGPVVGRAMSQGQQSIAIQGAVRSGDSGGGVFDSSGRLVAVVWGASEGRTYASTGAPLQDFLQRVANWGTPSSSPAAMAPATTLAGCPDGRCPLVGPGVLRPAPPIAPAPVADGGVCPCGCDKNYATLMARLDSLDKAKQDRGEYLLPTALDSYARQEQLTELAAQGRQQHESLVARLESLGPLIASAGRVAAPVAITALGISGPLGWGILATAAAGSWLIGRKMKSRIMQRAAQEATAPAVGDFPETSASAAVRIDSRAPIERDDREARELLRLSQLEGRDPLQDALAGRLALDRLDALAESDADPHRARLADDLRRELRERFNEIAPTKFQM